MKKYDLVKYRLIKSNKKDRVLKTVDQVKMYDYEFDKRMLNYENKNLITSFFFTLWPLGGIGPQPYLSKPSCPRQFSLSLSISFLFS